MSKIIDLLPDGNFLKGTIQESGSNSNGSYVKFTDGVMITYQEIEVAIPCNTSWGSLYVGNYDTIINFPQTFSEVPKVLIDLKLIAGACVKCEWETPVITKSTYKNIGIARGLASSLMSFTITLLSIGKWK